ncbi:MAG: TolC family protein [Limisphaerales bacterium]
MHETTTVAAIMRWTALAGAAALAAGAGTQAAGSPMAGTNSVRQLSLQECVVEALQFNLDVQIERYNPVIGRRSLSIAYADYDPTFRSTVQHNFDRDPGGVDAQGRPFVGRETDGETISAGLNGLLPSGMTYNIGTAAGNTRFNNQSIGALSESSFANWTIGELRQPLLRNSWIDGTRYNIRAGKIGLRQDELTLRYRVLTTVAAVEQAYYDLVATIENVRNAEKSVELADRLYRENQKRVQVGALAPLDEKESASQLASSRADLISAQTAVQAAENRLKTLITDKFEFWLGMTIRPTERLAALPEAFDVQTSWDRSLALRPDLQSQQLQIELQRLNIRYQRNQLFPQLDVFGQMAYSGSGQEFNNPLGQGTIGGGEFSDAYRQVWRGDAPSYAVGGSLSFPLSNRRARENFAIAKDSAEQAELRFRAYRQQVLLDVDNAIKAAVSAFERIGATQEARSFAEDALSAEEKKYQNGKSTSFLVLQAQQRLTSARLAELRALTDYNKALATLRASEGTTLERFSLDLGQIPSL